MRDVVFATSLFFCYAIENKGKFMALHQNMCLLKKDKDALAYGVEGGDSSRNSPRLETPQELATRRLEPGLRKASAWNGICSQERILAKSLNYLHKENKDAFAR